jgi:hypothetical protein
MLPAMVMVGVGAALVMPSVSASVMNSVPRGNTGVGSATNGTFIQLGGAEGVAVVGSLLSTRYQSLMRQAIAPYHVPSAIANAMLGSIGGALGVAGKLGGATGHLISTTARSSFISGADLGLLPAAAVVFAGCLLTAIALPTRPHRPATVDSEPNAVSPAQGPRVEWRLQTAPACSRYR